MSAWKPSAPIDNLNQRAKILRHIREFFFQRGVLEVDTPLIMTHSVTDPYMTALQVQNMGQTYFLQTSPEYAMKRLLCAGSGDIYQLAKNVRAEERGRKHQPEFTMLEWYRLGWNHHQLMDEVFQLVSEITGIDARENVSYRECFLEFLQFDPLTIEASRLIKLAQQQLGQLPDDLQRDDYLSLLFASKIEPQLGQNSIVLVYDFPASQAALARLNPDRQTAARFECYCRGIELANGFWELTDAKQQRQRFEQDNKQRKQMGKEAVDIDESFLSALEQGLPECSGVAMGVDRLLMIALGESDIAKVVPFAL